MRGLYGVAWPRSYGIGASKREEWDLDPDVDRVLLMWPRRIHMVGCFGPRLPSEALIHRLTIVMLVMTTICIMFRGRVRTIADGPLPGYIV